MDDIQLTDIQKLILYSLCRATQGSRDAHVPKPYFMNRPRLHGRNAERALRDLVALNYIIKHPTSGEMTYALDDRGLEDCRKLRDKLKML